MANGQIQCPHCGFSYSVTPEQSTAMGGRSFSCTNCGQPFMLSPAGAAFAPPPQQMAYASGANVKSNPLAIASLICGCVLCIPFATGIAAIVCGGLGMRKTKDPAVTGKGLAIAGLVLGIVNLVGWGAYVALIFAIMVPSMGIARQTANQVKCASNLRQIGLAILLYSNENGGVYPDSIDEILLTQDITAEVFVCPSSNDTKAMGQTPEDVVADMSSGGHLSYVYVGKGMTNHVSAKTIVAYEPLTNHNSKGANILFGDGSVEFIPHARAQRMIQEVEAGRNPPGSGGAATVPTEAPAEVEQ